LGWHIKTELGCFLSSLFNVFNDQPRRLSGFNALTHFSSRLVTISIDTVPRMIRFHLLLALFVVAAFAKAETYKNPVIPGDFPDPSLIRVGNEFWATATSSEWGPQFPLLHSTNLLDWELVGSVFEHRPDWAVANFWAPEISEYHGKYYVYYVGRKKDGPLAVAVAMAEKPSGPYKDYGPLVAQPDGSIDPVPVTNENDERYLVWKEDGNSRRQPTIIWAQQLTSDGLKLIGEPKEILRNDAPWEGAVVEGPFVVHRGEWFYLFYSGNGCCGRDCDYALGVARSQRLLGPWEKNPTNPILAGNANWKCPGHGSIVQDANERFWLLYHAYSARSFTYTGREALLDEVTFGTNGWPTINGGKGPSAQATAPPEVAQHLQACFKDNFAEPTLGPGWQWPQNNEPIYRLGTPKGGLELLPRPAFATNVLGAILSQRTVSGNYLATTVVDISDAKDGNFAGIAAIGDAANAVGLAVGDGKLMLWRVQKGVHQKIVSLDAPKSEQMHLRVSATGGRLFQFAASADGQTWMSVGGPQTGDQLPPWDRATRVGITVGGTRDAVGRFLSFEMR
jgi:xylan 1,4-beta-xylosidase